MKIVSGSSNQDLAQKMAKQLKIDLVNIEISKFPNGEKRIWIKEEVRGENIIFVQSLSDPTDERIIEFLLISDALERAGARHVNAVIPWMGYSIQDKVFREGEPLAAKVIASLISHGYIKRVFLLDLHNSSIPGFYSIPTHHLSAIQLFIDHVKKNMNLKECIVASPDFGGLKRARVFATDLGLELTNIDKFRDLHTGKVEAKGVHGDVEGKEVLVFDDFINSGSTVESCAEILKKSGAKAVHFFATHGIFANNGQERVQNSMIDTVIVTNSIPQKVEVSKLKVIDVSSIFANALAAWMPQG